jgi:hypothetical protein
MVRLLISNWRKLRMPLNQASKATGKHDEIIAQVLAEDVYARLEEEFLDKIPTVEEVQDIVEDMLIQYGYAETAKGVYPVSREATRSSREDRNVVVEVERAIQEYLDKLDWRVNAELRIRGTRWAG